MKRWILLLSAALVVVLTLVACTGEQGPAGPAGPAGEGVVSLPAGERVIHVIVNEPGGGTTTDKLAVPEVDPSKISAGYIYDPPGHDPDKPNRWFVEVYRYSPAAMVAMEGDQVTLKIFATNGNVHDTHITDPNGNEVLVDTWVTGEGGAQLNKKTGVDHFNTPRGRETTVTFKAGAAGIYTMTCLTHAPSMTASILVLPRP